MATAEAKTAGVVIVLEIDAAEAQYVADALLKVEPAHLEKDNVYDVLTDAMESAGVELDHGAADG